MEKSEWYDHFLKVLNDLLNLNEQAIEEINSSSVALNTSGDTNVYTVDKASEDDESQGYLNSDILPCETLEAISGLGNCKVVGSDGLISEFFFTKYFNQLLSKSQLLRLTG